MAKNHPKLILANLNSCFGVSMAFSGEFEILWFLVLWQGTGVVFLEKPSRRGASMTEEHPKPSFEGLKLVFKV